MVNGTINAVIVGATGYSGAELVSWLLGHPAARIVGLFGSSRRAEGEKSVTMGDLFPRLLGRIDLPIGAADVKAIAALKPDAVFLATPHEASVELAPEILAKAGGTWRARVFDLSGGFRLRPASLYSRYYGFEHGSPALLERAVYGLPELNRARIVEADLVAVPGCYPTSAILPLAPL